MFGPTSSRPRSIAQLSMVPEGRTERLFSQRQVTAPVVPTSRKCLARSLASGLESLESLSTAFMLLLGDDGGKEVLDAVDDRPAAMFRVVGFDIQPESDAKLAVFVSVEEDDCDISW